MQIFYLSTSTWSPFMIPIPNSDGVLYQTVCFNVLSAALTF